MQNTAEISISNRLTIKPEFAFGEKGNEKFEIPPKATVEYTVTLTEVEPGPDASKMSPEENLTQAKLLKEKATNFLKQEKYELAVKLYQRSNTHLSNCPSKHTDTWVLP